MKSASVEIEQMKTNAMASGVQWRAEGQCIQHRRCAAWRDAFFELPASERGAATVRSQSSHRHHHHCHHRYRCHHQYRCCVCALVMSVVHLQNVEILNPNALFTDPYVFKVTFESIAPLEDDLEWRLIYVGSAQSKDYDQELDNCLVGPVPVGVNSFEFEAAAPDSAKIPAEDLLGVTVILLTGSYNENEFIRVGYYVHNDYEDPELRETPPEKVDLSKVRREVLVEKPRVTRFNIKWYVLPCPCYVLCPFAPLPCRTDKHVLQGHRSYSCN